MKIEQLNTAFFTRVDIGEIDYTVRNVVREYVLGRLGNSEKLYDPQHQNVDIVPHSLEAVGTIQTNYPDEPLRPLVLINITNAPPANGSPDQSGEDSKAKTRLVGFDGNGLCYRCTTTGSIERYSLPYWCSFRTGDTNELRLIARDLLGIENIIIARKVPLDKEQALEVGEFSRIQQRSLLPLKGVAPYYDNRRKKLSAKIEVCPLFIPVSEESTGFKVNPQIVPFLKTIRAHRYINQIAPLPPPIVLPPEPVEKSQPVQEEQKTNDAEQIRDRFDEVIFWQRHDFAGVDASAVIGLIKVYKTAVKDACIINPDVRRQFLGWIDEKMVYLTAKSGWNTGDDAGFVCVLGDSLENSKQFLLTSSGQLYPITQGRGGAAILNPVSEPFETKEGTKRKILFGEVVNPVQARIPHYICLDGTPQDVYGCTITAVYFDPVTIVENGPDKLHDIIRNRIPKFRNAQQPPSDGILERLIKTRRK